VQLGGDQHGGAGAQGVTHDGQFVPLSSVPA
jgi:hypothetical protein